MFSLTREIVAYDADVISLQECDIKTFKYYLKPLMTDLGYSVHYTNKVKIH